MVFAAASTLVASRRLCEGDRRSNRQHVLHPVMKLADQNSLEFRGDNMGMSFDTCLNEQLPKLVVLAFDVTQRREMSPQ